MVLFNPCTDYIVSLVQIIAMLRTHLDYFRKLQVYPPFEWEFNLHQKSIYVALCPFRLRS